MGVCMYVWVYVGVGMESGRRSGGSLICCYGQWISLQ